MNRSLAIPVWLLLFVPATWLLFTRVVPATMEPPSSWIARLPAFAAPLFGAGLLIIPARGGVQLTSLNYSSVYFSTSDFANQATLNVLWNFLNSLYRGGAIQTNPYEVMPVAEATARMACAAGSPRASRWAWRRTRSQAKRGAMRLQTSAI